MWLTGALGPQVWVPTYDGASVHWSANIVWQELASTMDAAYSNRLFVESMNILIVPLFVELDCLL